LGSIFNPPVIDRPGVNELFARVGGNGPVQSSVPISVGSLTECASEDVIAKPIPASCRDATFQGAAADGSRVYFTSTQPNEVPGSTDETNNLYLARLDAAGLAEKVRVSAGDSSGEGARVQGVTRISDDGTHVFFVAQGVLTATPGPGGATPLSGADNLYAYDATTATLRFVAVLPSSESALWGDDNHRAAQATPDGRFLIFDTAARLTADDTDTAVDVYLYDSQLGTLVRVSKGHGGVDANGNNNAFDATINTSQFDNGSHASTNQRTANISLSGPAGRAMSADGSFVFFTSSEALQSTDVNSAPDVYEYHEGVVSLITDGHDPETGEPQANMFLATSSSGRDVFFQTTSVLDPAGGDGAVSIYDARIGGGLPPPPPAAAPCAGEACQGAEVQASQPSAPNSATYTGPGNLPPPVESAAGPVGRPLNGAQIRARRLAAALRACRRGRSGRRRGSCERQSRKRFAPVAKHAGQQGPRR
jgi:hypothetical protein